MNDLISRQAAIKAADSIIERDTSGNNDVVKAMTAWKEYIKALPPTQPGCEDTVYRKAVQMLLAYFVPNERYAEAVDGLRGLPSAQPVNIAKLQQTCNQIASDCISRQAALDAIKKLEKPAPTAQHLSAIFDCEDTIKALPSAQPGWIPCAPETMPKMTDIYLVKVGINQYGEGMYPTFRTALWHTASRKWFVHESENSIIGEVTEWMPIPWEGGQS